MMRLCFLVLIVVLAAPGGGGIAQDRPPAPDRATQCRPHLEAIGVIRDRIKAGREALTADEADCAFEEFAIGALSRHCAQVKNAAAAARRRTWNDIQQAWDALNRLRLQLRQAEERLGIECESG